MDLTAIANLANNVLLKIDQLTTQENSFATEYPQEYKAIKEWADSLNGLSIEDLDNFKTITKDFPPIQAMKEIQTTLDSMKDVLVVMSTLGI